MEENQKIWCGLDISKNDMSAALDIDRDLPVRKLPLKSFRRSLEGIRDMLDWCAEQHVETTALRVFMESTGIYSRDVLRWFQNNFPSIPVSVGNPRHVKHFIESEHLGNKTDALDALAIARMGTIQKPAPASLPPPEYLQLQELVRTRDELVTKTKSLEVSLKAMPDGGSVAARSLQHVVKVMAAELKKMDASILDLTERMPDIRAAVRRMCTMPGIGLISAVTILSELGPFSAEYSKTSFSAYTGLQPVKRQSGSSVNSSRIGKNGSPLLRKVLYLCSIHAVQKIPAMESMYSRLLARGKKPLSARCACMRKMLLILRSMVLNQRDFEENFVSVKKVVKAV